MGHASGVSHTPLLSAKFLTSTTIDDKWLVFGGVFPLHQLIKRESVVFHFFILILKV